MPFTPTRTPSPCSIQDLQLAPDDLAALNSKGLALYSLGDVYSALSQHQDAIHAFQDAIVVFDQDLQLAPDNLAAPTVRAWLSTVLGMCTQR